MEQKYDGQFKVVFTAFRLLLLMQCLIAPLLNATKSPE